MIKYGAWFDKDTGRGQIPKRWISGASDGKAKHCDRVWKHLVAADQPRLQVDNGKGPLRKRGKGKRHEYVCKVCALTDEGTVAPSRWARDKEDKLW